MNQMYVLPQCWYILAQFVCWMDENLCNNELINNNNLQRQKRRETERNETKWNRSWFDVLLFAWQIQWNENGFYVVKWAAFFFNLKVSSRIFEKATWMDFHINPPPAPILSHHIRLNTAGGVIFSSDVIFQLNWLDIEPPCVCVWISLQSVIHYTFIPMWNVCNLIISGWEERGNSAYTTPRQKKRTPSVCLNYILIYLQMPCAWDFDVSFSTYTLLVSLHKPVHLLFDVCFTLIFLFYCFAFGIFLFCCAFFLLSLLIEREVWIGEFARLNIAHGMKYGKIPYEAIK